MVHGVPRVIQTAFFDRLGCSAPIQLAGMGGMNPPELVAAVSNAGGLGMFGGAGMPAELIAKACAEARKLTLKKFGVNFLMPFFDKDALDAAATSADVIEFFYGAPDSALVNVVHRHGKLAFWQVGSVEEAVAAEKAGCDFIIAQGVEGGGHIRGTTALLPLLDAVLEAVRVPVIAAGGIATARSLAAVVAAGACAARIGTRFLAARESAAHPEYVRAILDAEAGDTELTEAFGADWPNAPHRVLRSSLAAAHAHAGDIVGLMEYGGGAHPVCKWTVAPPDKSATGNVRAMACYAGFSVGAVNKVEPAAEIVRDLSEGAERLLRSVQTGATAKRNPA
jgi:NAD(P)H-dependent flavin oxidoreductase YrpB (nitropropane dioxygenase family)